MSDELIPQEVLDKAIGFKTGKSVEDIYPVMQMLPSSATAISEPLSSPEPPR